MGEASEGSLAFHVTGETSNDANGADCVSGLRGALQKLG